MNAINNISTKIDKASFITIHLLIALFVLHLAEETITSFYKTDYLTNFIANLSKLTPEVTFLLVEIVLFAFLALILLRIIFNKTLSILTVILIIISLFEFTHIYDAVVAKTYTPGLITGIAIFLTGTFLTSHVLRSKGNS